MLNKEQEYEICYLIDEWYLEWKKKITAPGIPHMLGIAKEQLKHLLCSYPVDKTIERLVTTCEVSGIKFDQDGNVVNED